MDEKKYEKKLEFQKKLIARQSEQIEEFKKEIESLKLECQKKDETINSVAPLKDELTKEVAEIKDYKKQYKKLIDELKEMKKIMNKEAFKNRWWLIKLLLK